MCHFQCCVMSSVNVPAVNCLIHVSKGEIHSSLPMQCGGTLFRNVKTRENTSVLHILPCCRLRPNFL